VLLCFINIYKVCVVCGIY